MLMEKAPRLTASQSKKQKKQTKNPENQNLLSGTTNPVRPWSFGQLFHGVKAQSPADQPAVPAAHLLSSSAPSLGSSHCSNLEDNLRPSVSFSLTSLFSISAFLSKNHILLSLPRSLLYLFTQSVWSMAQPQPASGRLNTDRASVLHEIDKISLDL